MKKRDFIKLTLLALLLFSGLTYAQDKIDVNFQSAGDKILISYFLHGDPDKNYEINTVLRKSGDPSFKLEPKDLSGDVGEGKFANRNCTIIWNMNKDEEAKLEGEDFYFEVIANEIKEKSSWYWYVLGAAALGGGTAAYLLLNKDKSSGEGTSAPVTPAGDEVAMPPGRP